MEIQFHVKCDDPNCLKCVFNYWCNACEEGYGRANDDHYKCEKCKIKNCALKFPFNFVHKSLKKKINQEK